MNGFEVQAPVPQLMHGIDSFKNDEEYVPAEEVEMRTTERNPLQSSVEDLDNDSSEMQNVPSSGNALNSMVTKVP